MENGDDAALVGKCLRGDERAYRDLISRYRRQVYSLALRMMRSAEDAEDVTQETFVRMFRALERYDPTRPFGAWIQTIASRLCIDHLRRRRFRPVSLFQHDAQSDEEYMIEVEDPGPGPEVLTQHQEESTRADALIESLPEHYRIVVVLRHVQDLSYEEIAEALKLPIGTVKARIHRAREILKGRIEGRES